MYTNYFNLTAKPFELLPNPDFLYLSRGHRRALSHLQYGIQDRAGFTLLTGEIGSGKTTLVRDIVKQLNASTPLSMIFNTRVDATQLLAMINEDFGLAVSGKDKVGLLSDLNDFLITQSTTDRLPILIIDEAQNLNTETLEEVRLLSNLETDSYKLLQIILVGQPELKELIARPCLRQLSQRISIACHLGPLTREETEDYIYHRLTTAGNREAVTFTEASFDLIHSISGGVPRLINVICDFLLISAFVDETNLIQREFVREAVAELEIVSPASATPPDNGVAAGDNAIESVPQEERLRFLPVEAGKGSVSPVEREAIQDRLTSQGHLLEYLINKQQGQFREVTEVLQDITGQIDRIWQMMMPDPDDGVVNIDAHRKR